MLSNSCRYGIRALIYIASKLDDDKMEGIKQISKDLKLPTPFLAKILQQLVKQKMLVSIKGPHGGFSLNKDPKKITLYDIVKTIDGEGLFKDCIVHNDTCKLVHTRKKACPVHDDFIKIRKELIQLFRNTTLDDLVKKSLHHDEVTI